MSVLIRAHDVPAAGREDYWQQATQSLPFALAGRIVDGPDFRAWLLTGQLGPVHVTEGRLPAGECVRTRHLIRRTDPDLYRVELPVRGEVLVEQGDRQTRLAPGDLGLVEPTRPARYRHAEVRYVGLTFPRELLGLPADALAGLAAARVPGDRGTAALVGSLARQLPRHLDDVDPAEGVRLGTILIDLLATTLAARLDRRPDSEAPRRALLARIYAYIEQRLSDPDLSPSTIAAAHHISVRYLHLLFESEPATVAGWIRRRRLERCRQDLRNPALAARPVSAIAARWGFTNPAHFSRAFRAAYGVPPTHERGSARLATLR